MKSNDNSNSCSSIKSSSANFFNISKDDISKILPFCAAYCFFLSLVHATLFFSELEITPLNIPLSFSDYVMTFNAWIVSAVYLVIVYFLSCISATLPKNEHGKTPIKAVLTFVFLILVGISPHIFTFLKSSMESISIIITGILLYLFMTYSFFGDISKSKLSLISSIIVFTFSLCISFDQSIKNQIEVSLKSPQILEYRDKLLTCSLLRALDKGLLVYTNSIEYSPDKKPRILFLPYDKGPVLAFPTSLHQKFKSPEDQRPHEGLPDAG
ncbi:hypothetical protein [Desulfovibrio desulfuricans]|uniref:hypothetical protein n=1 Tax=Desulfovibrio desulfuricans TaxID=876 RepID=UPI001C01B146|nr:hypothetical protein [Desulfovibrio desulfuricans]MBT9748582.1 hypothetical protein [Desulfovibrio desulfuricans]